MCASGRSECSRRNRGTGRKYGVATSVKAGEYVCRGGVQTSGVSAREFLLGGHARLQTADEDAAPVHYGVCAQFIGALHVHAPLAAHRQHSVR